MALIQRTVLEKDPVDGKEVFMLLRFVIPNGGDQEVMSRDEITQFGQHSVQIVKNASFHVEREKLKLDILEAELRADLLDALSTVDISDPAVCREIYNEHVSVASSTGRASLEEAIGKLAEAGVDVTDFRTRLEAVYPLLEPDNHKETE